MMSFPAMISSIQRSLHNDNDDDSDSSASVSHQRIIVVANYLPLHSSKDQQTGKWSFTRDEDSLLLQLKDGLSPGTEIMYVGSLKVEIDINEQEEVARNLLDDYSCVPAFLPLDILNNFYHGFCKNHLWPLFHSMLPICFSNGHLFDRSLFQAYVSANRIFADRAMEVINSHDDYVWVHDYHLMLLPTFLRKKLNQIKIGFFLHSPFPSLEIYRSLPVREHILRGLLNADLIGFHTFDYARHFLSCCDQMLGLNHQSKRGYIEIEYAGRTIGIKILPVGVHIERLQSLLSLPATISKVQEIEKKFEGKMLIMGADDMDIFKGINLKLLALEVLFNGYPALVGKVVLVQIVNPARSSGKAVEDVRTEAMSLAQRINRLYGAQGYNPVVLIDHSIPLHEKIAFYAAADCCIVNAVKDGMNLVPYEYVICRQGTEEMNKLRKIGCGSPRTSALIVSEFMGCSPSLSGAFRVNPWSVEDVAIALHKAIYMGEHEKQLRHRKHYDYVSSHHVSYWARSFVQDLERACKDHRSRKCWAVGLGLDFRVVALSPSFQKLSVGRVVSSYRRSGRRAIFLDYDGTITPNAFVMRAPDTEIISLLNTLCADPRNSVFIVSGRGRDSLAEWFSACGSLGIAAEHGYFTRRNVSSGWETSSVVISSEWKKIAEPVMRLYTETTDESYIEVKETALVWHHERTGGDFGSLQAKRLRHHLKKVLANEPVVVKIGHGIVEVKPQGVSKGLAVERLLKALIQHAEWPDFLMCIGDDRSDEDMFESIDYLASGYCCEVPEVFPCTVGQKRRSKAKYYVNGTEDVIRLLEGIANVSTPRGVDM